MTEDERVGWRHSLDGHEFEQAPGDGEGQGSLACYSPRSHKESDTTEPPTGTEGRKETEFCQEGVGRGGQGRVYLTLLPSPKGWCPPIRFWRKQSLREGSGCVKGRPKCRDRKELGGWRERAVKGYCPVGGEVPSSGG